jgi:hypothetical protein
MLLATVKNNRKLAEILRRAMRQRLLSSRITSNSKLNQVRESSSPPSPNNAKQNPVITRRQMRFNPVTAFIS